MTILLFFVVLSVLVLFHECGHYLMARFFGVKAEEFGLGFPPRALGFVKEGGRWRRVKRADRASYPTTIWSLNWLPLGGFVRLKGEQEAESKDADSFASKPAYARAWILVAGVLMNWFLAFLIFFVGFIVGVPTDLDALPKGAHVRDPRVEITQVLDGSPAAQAGLRGGDRVVRIGGRSITTAEEARTALSEQSQSQTMFQISIVREGSPLDMEARPTYLEALKRSGIGVGLADVGVVRLPLLRAFPQAAQTTYAFTKLIVQGFWHVIRSLVVERDTSTQLSGPVGIAVMTGKVAAQGIWPLLQFAAILSINLAVVNLLPIPALDGGRLVFVFLEMIRRKKRSLAWEARLHQFGFLLLLTLILLITVRDVGVYGAPVWQAIRQKVGF